MSYDVLSPTSAPRGLGILERLCLLFNADIYVPTCKAKRDMFDIWAIEFCLNLTFGMGILSGHTPWILEKDDLSSSISYARQAGSEGMMLGVAKTIITVCPGSTFGSTGVSITGICGTLVLNIGFLKVDLVEYSVCHYNISMNVTIPVEYSVCHWSKTKGSYGAMWLWLGNQIVPNTE